MFKDYIPGGRVLRNLRLWSVSACECPFRRLNLLKGQGRSCFLSVFPVLSVFLVLSVLSVLLVLSVLAVLFVLHALSVLLIPLHLLQ